MKPHLLFAVSCLLFLGAPGAHAVVCTQDDVPGATLLLPYFAVDFGASLTANLLEVHNASAQPVLAHAVLWSDLSVPVMAFDFYLKRQGTVEINLRSLLTEGLLPNTPPAPGEFPSCVGFLPSPRAPASFVEHLQRSLTGKLSAVLAGCAGRDLGDNVARGYVTIDTVSQCSIELPSNPGYFKPGGQGIATNQNALWGSYISVDSRQRALSQRLIALEASSSNPQTSKPGNYTFYGRFVGWSGADNREPLATLYGVQFLGGPGASEGTDLIVWRDPRTEVKPFKCPAAAGRPKWFPLPTDRIRVYDDAGTVLDAHADLPLPAASQRVNLQTALPSLPPGGTVFLNLNARRANAPAGPAEAPNSVQGWVTALAGDQGNLLVDLGAVRYDTACAPGLPLPPP